MSITVGELINKLNCYPFDKKVYILSRDDNPIGGGCSIENVFEINGSDESLDNAVYIVED